MCFVGNMVIANKDLQGVLTMIQSCNTAAITVIGLGSFRNITGIFHNSPDICDSSLCVLVSPRTSVPEQSASTVLLAYTSYKSGQ
ncbi:Hypothetical predicted protein [Octopus vulgaris]|uniref:Uncharacterized protein n=1 Tax=Octopus vulgaris TaxID=6645 RepID=A0AA36B1Z8_OCTVU|nr:Hypothetical predicted protein [Octopus vulgaris]